MLCAALAVPASAQLTISEFLADNTWILADRDGDFPDWVEIYNGGASGVNLAGYHLTDDPAVLAKWTFPGVSLGAGEFLVVFASGKDRALAGAELHTNFQLGRSGEYLALVEPDGVTIATGLAPAEQHQDVSYGVGQAASIRHEAFLMPGAPCTLLVPSADIGLAWIGEGFDDSAWRDAATGVGYELADGSYPDLFGVLGDVEGEMANQRSCVYLRVPFELAAGATVSSLTLKMKYDDGFVAYLNGMQVADSNGPSAPEWNSVATTPHRDINAVVYENYDLTVHAGLLHPGTNLLAIHGLNDAPNSSDFLILPELHGTTITVPSAGEFGYLPDPTPGARNGQSFDGLVDDTQFSIDRGFYAAPFDVVITCSTPGATIVHTTDGSAPSDSNGIRSAPAGPDATGSATVRITTTTNLRAIATKPGHVPSNVDTQTYLFLQDVLAQPEDPAGFPDTWGRFLIGPNTGSPVPADYDIWQTAVTTHAATIIDDLMSLPTLSIVMDREDLFGSGGLYSVLFPARADREHTASLEWIDPASLQEFQLNAGIRLFGGGARFHGETPKKSFMLRFRRDHDGPPKLNFPLFAADQADSAVDAVEEFETIALRGVHGDAWQHPNSQYIIDSFVRYSQLAMGRPGPHGRWLHLYLNGLYWGLYNATERPDADHAASYFGGRSEDYDAIKHASNCGPDCYSVDQYEVIDGNGAAWQTALNLAAAGLTGSQSYAQFKDLVDVENLADYILLNHYVINTDWPHKNWYATRRREPGAGFKFYCWDAEYSLGRGGGDFQGSRLDVANPNTPGFLYNAARQNVEFRVLFGDRVHKHLFNDGALQADKTVARYRAIAAGVEGGIRTESARWGDYTRNPGTNPFTYAGVWIPVRNSILNTWLPQRYALALSQIRGAGLYPSLGAPTFNRHGGIVPDGFELIMNGPGTVYYTLDGSDPRLPGGAVSSRARIASGSGLVTEQVLSSGAAVKALVPVDGSLGTNWTATNFDDAGWTSGTSGVGYDLTPEFDALLGLDVEAGMLGRSTTVYTRSAFEVSEAGSFQSLTLRMKYDDGFVAYLNGTQIASANAPAAPTWNSEATAAHRDSEAVVFRDFNVSAHRAALRTGTNVLAIHGLNLDVSGSDHLILPELQGQALSGGSRILLNRAVVAKARSRSGSSWSALTEASFHAGSVTPNPSNLAISKIHYRPQAPSSAELAAGHNQRSDFEFVELMNIGARPVTLAGMRFAGAFSFPFPDDASSELSPGARLLVVKNRAAFEFRNGAGHPVAGEFTDGKLNDDGEQILLLDRDDRIILSVTYNDAGAWPDSPDGGGPALVLVSPEDAPDLGDPASWRPSVHPDGTPGGDDRHSLTDWLQDNGLGGPDDDPSGIGISNLLAFAVGADLLPVPHAALPQAPTIEAFAVGGVVDHYPVFRYRRRIGADHLVFRPETTPHPGRDPWASTGFVHLSTTDNDDGTMTIAVRPPTPVTAAERQGFFRLSVGGD